MFSVRFLISNLFSIISIGFILILKKVFRNRLSLKFHYHIWFVFLFSLVIVFLPASFFQAAGLENIAEKITASSNELSENINLSSDTSDDWKYDFIEMKDNSDHAVLNKVLLFVWLAGAFGITVFYHFGNRKLRVIKRFSQPPPDHIMDIFSNCCAEISVKSKICLLQSDMITSPLSFGCIKPCVILPCSVIQGSGKKEIEHILLHELMHIKHRDIWINLCFCAEQIVYWFNPLIWRAFSEMRRDREAYCDWSVLNIYNSDEQRLCYGETLLQFAGQKNNALVYTVNSLFENKSQLRYRIERIADFRKETKKAKIIGVSCILIMVLSVMVQAPVFAAFASDFGLNYSPDKAIEVMEQDYSYLYGSADGCAVIYDMNSDSYSVYNKKAMTKRIAPCSTYKIYSAVNALEQGIISANDNAVDWDNVSREFSSWNADQTLDSAMRNSVNWYFQLLDKTAGADELQDFYKNIGYGNSYVGSDTENYWNGSALKISPLEQVELLVKLYNNDFGFNDVNIDAVKQSLYICECDGNALYGKTGTGVKGNNDVNGWFVGYVEADNNTYFFAVNLQDDSNANGSAAAEIAYAVFEEMGIKLN